MTVAQEERGPVTRPSLVARMMRAAQRRAALIAGLALLLAWELGALLLAASGTVLAASKLPAPHAIAARMLQ